MRLKTLIKSAQFPVRLIGICNNIVSYRTNRFLGSIENATVSYKSCTILQMRFHLRDTRPGFVKRKRTEEANEGKIIYYWLIGRQK